MQNEYAPPRADVADVNRPSGNITDAMMESLRGTKPWTMLIAVVLFITAGFLLLGTFGVVIGGMVMSTMGGEAAPNSMPLVFLGIGIVYLMLTVIYFMLGLYLVKFSTAIGRLLTSGQPAEMASALEQQRKFWKVAGIMTIVGIVLMIVWFIVLLLMPGIMRMGGLQ